MTELAVEDLERLRTLLASLQRLVEVPEGHVKRLSPLLKHRLAEVVLAYLAVREFSPWQQTEAAVVKAAQGSGPLCRPH